MLDAYGINFTRSVSRNLQPQKVLVVHDAQRRERFIMMLAKKIP
jgi:hypothetical protein